MEEGMEERKDGRRNRGREGWRKELKEGEGRESERRGEEGRKEVEYDPQNLPPSLHPSSFKIKTIDARDGQKRKCFSSSFPKVAPFTFP